MSGPCTVHIGMVPGCPNCDRVYDFKKPPLLACRCAKGKMVRIHAAYCPMQASTAPKDKPKVYKVNAVQGRGTWVCEVVDGWSSHVMQAPDWSTALLYALQWVASGR